MTLKILSAFLGRDKGQVPAVVACAKEAGAEVLCLQEVMDFELPDLQKVYDFVRFVPMTRHTHGSTMGLAMCTNLPVGDIREQYYMGDATQLAQFDESTPDSVNKTKCRPLLTCAVRKEVIYQIGNTHFLYSKDGKPGAYHLPALISLTGMLVQCGSLILCGAMVTPRDSALYKEFVEDSGLADWVPRTIHCTLDAELHKLAPALKSGAMPPVVVDYIFATGYLRLEEVRQFSGISDHTPLLAVAY